MKQILLATLGLLALLVIVGLVSCSKQERTEDRFGGMESVAADWFHGRPLYEVYTRAYSFPGTFDALRKDLPELKRRGITNLWLMPIHPIGEQGRKGKAGCPYSVQDYFAVSAEYGGMHHFENLVYDAHSLGMHVIIDMVLNHAANDHVEMERHPDWFAQDSTGAFTREVSDWSDVTDWNYDDPEVQQYLARMLQYWVQEIDVDGFRCDVADMVPRSFWQEVIPKLKEIKPGVFLLAESQDPERVVDGFHAIYDWELYHRMKEHHAGGIDTDSLWGVVDWFELHYPVGALPLRFIENHDEPRSAEVFGWPGAKPYAALIFTLPGIPLVYNGQEVGATHRPSLFEQVRINWDREGAEDVQTYYNELLKLRQTSEVLRKGDLARLDTKDDADVLVFERVYDDRKVVVAINFSDQPYSTVLGPDLTIALEPYAYDVIER